MADKVTFERLSAPLKTLVVFGWIYFGLVVIAFITGYVEAL